MLSWLELGESVDFLVSHKKCSKSVAKMLHFYVDVFIIFETKGM